MDWTAIAVITGLIVNAVVVGIAWGDTRRTLKQVCHWQEQAEIKFTEIDAKFVLGAAEEATDRLKVEHRITKLEKQNGKINT